MTTQEKNMNLLPDYLDELVPAKRTFKKDCKIEQLIQYIVKDINKSSKKSKTDLSTLERICTLIENCVTKDDNINKIDVLIDVCKILFGTLTAPEIERIKSDVAHMVARGIIKKVTNIKRCKNYVYKCISSQIFF